MPKGTKMRKIMPKTPNNPEFLYNILESQTRALAKILAGQKLAKERRIEYDAETAEVCAVESMQPLLHVMSPESRVLNRVIASGSAKAMTALFEAHGADVYRDAFENRKSSNVTLGDAIRQPNLDLLKVIHNAGINLLSHDVRMISQAVRHRNLDYLSFIRNDIGSRRRILGCTPSSTVLDNPWLPIIDEVAAELREFVPQKDSDVYMGLIRSMHPVPSKSLHLRKFAILLHLSPDDIADDFKSRKIKIDFPGAQRLLDMTQSNHGKLALLQMEPDLESILTRRSNLPFYGITEADIKEHSKILPG